MPRENEETVLEDPDELEIDDEVEESPDYDQEEAPDRGDVVTDPDAAAEEEEASEEEGEIGDEPEAEGDESEADQDTEEESEGQTVPIGRFTNVNLRMKKAEAELIRRDEARVTTSESPLEEEAEADVVEEAEDVGSLWDKYHGLNETGDFDEARDLLGDIQKAQDKKVQKIVADTIESDRAARNQQIMMDAARVVGTRLKKTHLALQDTDSEDYKTFTAFADSLYAGGKDMSAALEKAAEVLFGGSKTETPEEDEEVEVDKKKETAAERKRAAILKNAKAAAAQPAPLNKGTGQGQKAMEGKRKMADLTEEEFDALPDKAKDRGDKV